MPTSRTLGPLHFEDLEPHRFEDLVRQLAYGFRTWSALEATGRLGNDEGVDIRGIEAGVARPRPGTEPDDIDLTEEEEDPISFEREWRFQCKRYRTLRPGEMKKVVADLVPDAANPPHGVVVAAACDVSGRAIETFHTEAAQLGVREHFLWTNAHIEDMLFRPDYDHLLFAYFGVSLRVRRASRLQEVRSRIALKRKLTRAFNVSDLTESLHLKEVIVRDVEYSGRLLRSDLPDDSLGYPPWHKVWAVGFHPVGLAVQAGRFDGWLRGDGVWDILEATESLQAQTRRDPEAYTQYLEAVPEDERVIVARMALLPYRAILEVDPLGDLLFDEEHFGALPVHLFCDFGFGEHGPYVTYDDGESSSGGRPRRSATLTRVPLNWILRSAKHFSKSAMVGTPSAVSPSRDERSTSSVV